MTKFNAQSIDDTAEALLQLANQINEHPESKKVYKCGRIIMGMMLSAPFTRKFYITEGKSVSGLVGYLDEKFGADWIEHPDANAVNDAMFEYYEITDEALAAVNLN